MLTFFIMHMFAWVWYMHQNVHLSAVQKIEWMFCLQFTASSKDIPSIHFMKG